MQQTPPELPPTRPINPAAGPVRRPRRFRQAFVTLASGLALIAVVCGGELVLRDGLKPSDLTEMVEARIGIKIMNRKLDVKPGEHVLTEADYRKTLAFARRQGAAQAAMDFQRQLDAANADRERIFRAYSFLYQRNDAIAHFAVQMDQTWQDLQRVTVMDDKPPVVIGATNLLCNLGSPEACDLAKSAQQEISEQAYRLHVHVRSTIRTLMSGIADPATFAVRNGDRRRCGSTIQR